MMESQDSTPKKLVYQIPFKDLEKLSPLLKDVEQNF